MIVYFAKFTGNETRYWGINDTWFMSYEKLPEQLKDAIATLNVTDTRQTIAGVGTRYSHYYDLECVLDATMRGRNEFEDVL